MIISASRRTDIPNYYADWFLNRLKVGFVLVRNPVNPRQVGRVRLSPDVVDGIVFWTKNPAPMLGKLELLKDYAYYFQFTVTPYGKDIEPGLPPKDTEIIRAFRQLSDRIGPERVVWRYDPILLTSKYTGAYHIRAFEKLAKQLSGYTNKCTVSFIDLYRSIRRSAGELGFQQPETETIFALSAALSEIARGCGLQMDACAEKTDLRRLGIGRARCIDGRIFEKMLGCALDVGKDKNQRPECGCVTSIDIGMYNTCPNGCRYCYANHNGALVRANYKKHDPASPLLTGETGAGDVVYDREIKSFKDAQTCLPDAFI